VWTLTRAPAPLVAETLVLRDAAAQRTADAEALRRFSGFA
jgi:hypothetical protein